MSHGGQHQMKKRQITLKDGRYLIFYTFEGHAEPPSAADEAERAEPQPGPRAKDERDV